jgi:porin
VSSRARALDIDFQQFVGAGWPTRSFEALATAVYQYEVRAGWTLSRTFNILYIPGVVQPIRWAQILGDR